jgi:hypothetical protein
VPLIDRVALEPAIDFHRVQTRGVTLFAGNAALRANYAIVEHVYAAAGGNLIFLKGTGFDAQTISGANIALGYRFSIGGGVRPRLELDYTMMKENARVPFPAVNTVSVQLGAAFPVR